MINCTKSILFLTVIGMFLIFSMAQKSPGSLTMVLSYTMKNSDFTNVPRIEIVIEQSQSNSKNRVFQANDYFKQIPNQNSKFEFHIQFPTENIKHQISFTGKMTIKSPYATDIKLTFHQVFSFKPNSLKLINDAKVMSQTFYTKDLLDEMDVIITAKCQSNYYPENVCDIFCFETKNTKECDKNGNKICETGYNFNPETMSCDNDWCWLQKSRCLNGGTCINGLNNFHCKCPISYKGLTCEEYDDVCLRYKCPNETTCLLENNKIHCKPIVSVRSVEGLPTKKPESLFISFSTMVVMAIAIVVMATAFCVTCWACRKPKEPEFRSSDESMNGKPISYFNYMDSRCNPHLVPIATQDHWHCSCKCSDKHMGLLPSQIDNYYSLRIPHDRETLRSALPNSDTMMSRGNGRVSRASSIHTTVSNSGADCESLPLPPPIANNNTFCI